MSKALRIPAPVTQPFDRDEANRLIDEAFDQQGWLQEDLTGEIEHDTDKAKHAVFLTFTTNHVVTATATGNGKININDVAAERAVTRLQLYGEVFPLGPGASAVPETPEEEHARSVIADWLWRLTTPTNRKAWLQREVATSGLMVIETKVYPSSDPTIPLQPARFVTDIGQAMLEFLDTKVLDAVRKQMDEADAWLATLSARNPQIAVAAAKKAQAALQAAVKGVMHADPAFVRHQLALTAGTDSDEGGQG